MPLMMLCRYDLAVDALASPEHDPWPHLAGDLVETVVRLANGGAFVRVMLAPFADCLEFTATDDELNGKAEISREDVASAAAELASLLTSVAEMGGKRPLFLEFWAQEA